MYHLSQNLLKKAKTLFGLLAFVFISVAAAAQPTSSDNMVTGTEDNVFTFGNSDFPYSDSDPMAGVRIMSISGNGTLFYDLNNDGVVDAGESISPLPFDVPVANISLLKYSPLANDNGLAVANFEFRVYNNNTPTPEYSATHIQTINITAVNDAPTAGSNTISCFENSNYALAVTHFNYSDPDGDPLLLYLVSVPGNGSLWLDANSNGQIDGSETVYSAGDNIPEADITSGHFRFKPDDNENNTTNGAPYGTFDFYASDGIANTATYTMTINVTPVNSEPSFANGGNITVQEDDPAQTVAAWANPINPGAVDEGAQTFTFYVSNNLNSLFAVQPDIDPVTGDLTFTPAPNEHGVATVTAYLRDNGGTANGGDDTSPNVVFTITVTSVNDAPTAADNTINCIENHSISFANPQFGYVDADADALTQIEITTAPADGTLWIDANGDGLPDEGALTGGAVVPVTDINAGRLKFRPVDNENGVGYTSFQFRVYDGTVYSAATYTMTIDVQAVNSEPYFTIGSNQVINEDAGAQTVNNWATGISPGAPDEGGQTLDFVLTNNNNLLFATQPAVSPTGVLTYTPAADASGMAIVSIYLHDDGGIANDGDDTSPTQTFTITINPVNDPPTAADNTVNCFENNTLTFVEAMFSYADNEFNPFSQLEITSSVGTGTLWLDTDGDGIVDATETILSGGSVVPIVSINSGFLKFRPLAHENSAPAVYTAFTFRVHDGMDYSVLPAYTMNIIVEPVNSEPGISCGLDQTIAEDAGAQTVAGWATGITAGAPDEDPVQTLTLHISNDNNALFVTQPTIDLATGALSYEPAPNANGVANVDIYVTDNGGVANGGDDESPHCSFQIIITDVNDPPVLVNNNPLNINEGDVGNVIPVGLLSVTDDDNAANEIIYTVTSLPSEGILFLGANPIALNGTFTQADIDANNIHYNHSGGEVTPDNFDFTVSDGDGGSIPTNTFVINITPVNDPPAFTSTPITVGAEGVVYTYVITTTDPDGPLPLTITGLVIPAWATFTDNGNGTALITGTPPAGAPANNPVNIIVSDGIAPDVTQSFNIMLSTTVVANAGPDDETCNNNTYTLAATPAPAGYIGTWSVIDGNGTFSNVNDPNAIVSNMNNGLPPNNANTYRWTLTNPPANDQLIYDDVVIINNSVSASVTDMTDVCGSSTVLQADAALQPGETGIWTVEGTPIPMPTIVNPNNRITPVHGLNFNTNQFRWTVTKGSCSAFAIMNVDVIEVSATAGGPGEVCSEPFTIIGNDPTLLDPAATGVWSVAQGAGVFASATDPTTTVTASSDNVPNEYRWTVSVNGCQAQASVVVENNIPTPAVITTPDPTVSCNGNAVISAQPVDPTDPNETGYWTCATPGVVIAQPNNPTTNVTNLQEGANLFTWHVENGTCPASTADLTINYYDVVTVDAGDNQTLCSDVFSLAATPLGAGETGEWTFVTGGTGATIVDPTNSVTQVIDLPTGLNVLQWEVRQGGTGANSCSQTDQIELTNLSVEAEILTTSPAVACTDPSQLITANNPATQDIANPSLAAIGSWAVISGGSTIDNPNYFETTFSNLDEGVNKYTWTITNGQCSDVDTITVINSIPTQADAGRDTIVCSTTLDNLHGNEYEPYETGFWRVIAAGATLTTPSLANTSVTNLEYNCTEASPDWWAHEPSVNIFEWVIRREAYGVVCESTDQVEVINGLPSDIDAGLDQTVCENVVNLDALDEASCAQEHWWEQLPDVGNFEDPFTGAFIPDNNHDMPYNVHVDNIQDGMTQFVWHLQNSFLDSQGNPIECHLTDTVEITSLGLQEDVDAGQNYVVCDSTYILNATPADGVWPASGYDVYGEWSITHGHGTFVNPTLNSTEVTGLGYDTNIFRWTVYNVTEGCIATDDVYIHNALPSAAEAGPDREVCDRYTVISANNPPRADNQWWTTYSGGGTITGQTCANYFCTAQIDNMADGKNTFVWHVNTVYTGPIVPYTATNPFECELTDTINIINNRVTASAGADIYMCADTAQLLATPVSGGSGYWLTSVGTFASTGGVTSTMHNDIIRGLTKGQNTLTWRVQKGICPASDDVVVWNMLPPEPYANVNQTVCSASAYLSASPSNLPLPQPSINSYYHAYWSANGTATIQTPSAYNTRVDDIPEQSGTYFIWHTLNDFDDGIEQHQCELTDTMYIYNNSVTAEAGSDLPIQCGVWGVGADFQLNANPAYEGVWTGIPAPGATITAPSLHNTTVTGALDGDHTYQWSVSYTTNGVTCSDVDYVNVPVRIPTTSVVAPDYLEICEDEVPLQANNPFSGIGTWSEVTTGGATILDPTNNITQAVSVSRNGNSIFRWTIDRDGCTSEDEIVVENNTILADADDRIDLDATLHTIIYNDTAVCTDEYLLSATDPNIFNMGSAPYPQGVWTWSPGTVTLDNPTLYNTTVRNLYDSGDNTTRLTWTITKGSCVEASRLDIVNNSFNIDADVNETSNELETCDGNITLDGEQPGADPGDAGLWDPVSGGGVIVNPTLYNTQVIGVAKPFSVYKWTVFRDGCEASDQVTVYNNTVTANAGVDFPVCTSTANLPGTPPAAGETGNWLAIIGGASVTTPSLFNSEVTNLAQGQNQFRWEITKGNCHAYDTVEITNNEPNAFAVEANKQACSPNTSISVNPAPDYAFETGLWSVDIGGASTTVTNPTAINANVVDMQPGTNRFIWTVTRGACTREGSIVVTNNQVIPDAGSNEDICADSIQLKAADPTISYTQLGDGAWTQTMGTGATFDNPSLFNTWVRNLSPGQNTFRWTLTEGMCVEHDDVSIYNNSVKASASDRIVCTNTLTLDGNMPTTADWGEWTLVASSGTPDIVTPSSGTTTVNDLGSGQNTFKWILSNAEGCSDSIEISVNNAAFTTSAGPNDTVCATNYVLNGTDHGAGYSGHWTVPGGTGSVAQATLFNSAASGLSPGDNVFRWTVTSDLYGCTAVDEVTIRNNNPSLAHITSPAPTDREVCSNTVNVEAIQPVYGTGTWTCAIPAVTFDNKTLFQTVARDLGTGTNEITWTVNNGICKSIETIEVVNNEVAAVAGSDQPICADSTYLNATDPSVIYPNQGVGYWTNATANTALIANSLLPGTQVTNLPIGTTVFRWTVEQGSCVETDDVAISNNSVVAFATDQDDCGGTFTLNGNDPSTFGGSGLWSIIGGGSGTIAQATLYNTQVSGVPAGTSTSLNWYIENATCNDSIQIELANNSFTVYAGTDITTCTPDVNLNAPPLIAGQTGLWTRLNGSGTITNNTLHNTSITGLGQGPSEYQWTVSNSGGCSNSDNVTITNNAPSTAQIIGPADPQTCNGEVTLEANLPTPIYADAHYWEPTTGGGTFTTPSTGFTTSVTGLQPGNNTFVWTIERIGCPPSQEAITIVNNEVVAVAGSDQPICDDNTYLNATDPGSIYPNQGTGVWTDLSGTGAVIVNSLAINTEVTDLAQGTTTFQWTVSKGGCFATDQVQIINNSVQAIAADKKECSGTFVLNGNDPSSFGGTGYWDVVAGSGAFTTPSTLYNATFSGVLPGSSTTLRWLVDNGICKDSTDITVKNEGFALSAGADYADCIDTYTLNADDPAPGTGYWDVVGGSGFFSNSTQYDATVSGLGQGNNVLSWTVTKGNCTDTAYVTITNNNPEIAVITGPGPANRETCTGQITVQGNDPSIGTGVWTVNAGNGIFANSLSYQTLITGLDPGPNTLTWTISKGSCKTAADIIIINNIVAAEAGPEQLLCADTTTLNATATTAMYPFHGTGSWTYLGGGSVLFENSLLPNSKVSGLPNGINTFRWTVEQGKCSTYDDVIINNRSVTAFASDDLSCADTIPLKGNNPAPGETGFWTSYTPGVTFDNSVVYNTVAHGLAEGNNTFIWTIDNGDCSDEANINIRYISPVADAGHDQPLCDDFTFLAAADPAPGTGVWTVVTNAGTFANSTSNGTYVSNIGQGLNVYRWTVTEAGCVKYSDVNIYNNLPTVNAGPDQPTCGDSITLSGNTPATGSGVWTQTGGIMSASITTPSMPNSTVTGLSNGASIFTWTVDNGICSASDQVTITFNEVIADAGADKPTCDATAMLMAKDPAPGTGYWEAIGAGTFADVSSANTTVSGLAPGQNSLCWHQFYSGCSDVDTIVITNNQVYVEAGTVAPVCDSTATLLGSIPGPTASGFWTRSGGTGTVTNSTFYNSTVTGLSRGINTFTWTVTDGPCTNSDDVVVVNNQITSINAGVDFPVCDSLITLSALAPHGGETGFWKVSGGYGEFDNSAQYNTVVRNLDQGENRFVWTLDNGNCTATDTVVITNMLPTTALVSADIEICSSVYLLVGNSPIPGESGVWTKEFGATATIDVPSSSTTTAYDIGPGSNTFRWTISNENCSTYDDIIVTNNSISTDAGLDAPTCVDTAALSADNPAPGTGYWSVINAAGTPVFDNSTVYNTVVRNLASGANIFKWTAQKGNCPAWDIVTITNDTPTPADAGPDRPVCDGQVVLSGNNPSVGTGMWDQLGGAGSIAVKSNYNTLVTGLSAGGNTFRWEITQGICKDHDDVLITNNLLYASAGMDDETCGTTYPSLNGNQPGPGETGKWTVTGGTGSFDNNTLYNTGVSGLSGSENRLTWTISKGNCSNSDDVSIFNNTPSQATVISNKDICTDTLVISGNPPVTGTGTWYVDAGSGSFDNSTSNTTMVRNIGPDMNQYRWTISNGSCTSSAIVTINNYSVDAIVGGDIDDVCGTTAYLNGNEPGVNETGQWTVIAGSSTVANTALYNSEVTGLNKGENKFRWTIRNFKCSDYADLVVTNNLYDANASIAGPDTICKDSADLLGNIPVAGAIGTWSVPAGGGSFDDVHSPSARVKGLLKGDNTLRWTVTKAGCPNFDEVTITNNMVEASAGPDKISCGNDVRLVGNKLLPGETGLWTNPSGSGTILTPSNNETIITGQGPGVNVFEWTVSGNGCTAKDQAQVFENSFITSAGYNDDVCDTMYTLQAQDPGTGTGLWTYAGPGVVIVEPTSHITLVTGLQDNTPHTFTWTVHKNGCVAKDDVIITNNLVHAYAGEDHPVCHSEALLSAGNPIAGSGLWDVVNGAGFFADPTNYSTTVTGLLKGQNTLSWTVTSTPTCFDVDYVVITNNIVLATAGSDQEICQDSYNLAGDPPQDGGYGLWEPAGGPGVILIPSAFNSPVVNLRRGVNTFRWTVYENGCDNGGDLVQIVNNDFDAYAGEDQTLPPLTTATNFNAVLPPTGSGQWSIASGSGGIADVTSPSSYVDNMPTGVNEFTWKVTKTNGCSSTDKVAITVANFNPDAGEDQVVCQDTAVLNAVTVLGASSQRWFKVQGGGSFDDPYDPKTVVRGLNPGDNVFRWKVSFVGYSDYDDVVITNDSIFVGAGDDKVLCEQTHQMNAQHLEGADELWTIIGLGGGTIINNTLYNTEIEDLSPGTNYFVWSVDNGNCKSVDTVAITYNLPPIAQFETNPTEFCAPDSVLITNTSSYHPGLTEPDEFRWRVEDNYIGTTFDVGDSIMHYFTNTGTTDSVYTIHLVAIDNETMCTDTFRSTVTAFAHPNVEFRIGGSHIRRIPNATFNFENRSATNLDAYLWDFGWAGHNRYDTAFVGSFDFTYQEAGTYTITLTGTSPGQCSGMYQDTVVVLPPCPFSYDDGSLIAEGCQDLLVEFEDAVYYADSVVWKFYDINDDIYSDTLSRENNPIFTYTEPGEYHPTIIAWNAACGSEDNPFYTRTDTVIVHPKPVVDFEVAPRLVMLPDQVLSCYNYSDYGSRYIWDFGDGSTVEDNPEVAEENPQHQYTAPGVYDIKLNVWSDHDCYNSKLIRDAIIVQDSGLIEFPTAFTPNPHGGNGGVYPCGEKYVVDNENLNDVFFPKANGVVEYHLDIYNRWGEKIFTSNDLCIGWDGYIDGVLAPQDVYVWRVSVIYKNGNPHKALGSVTLLR